MNTQPHLEESLKPFFECSIFKDRNFPADYNKFYVEQDELFLLSVETDDSAPEKKVKFGQRKSTYTCEFECSGHFDSKKPALLLCIKDNLKLLAYTLNNLKEYSVDKLSNIIVIDDRSTEDLKSLSLERGYSYLKISYENDFNFSMINNIAAKLAHNLGCKNIVLWNSDMWAHDSLTLETLLNLHEENEAQISGTKLVYPSFRWDGDESKEGAAISTYFTSKAQTYRGTTQFGGIIFTFAEHYGSFAPNHAYRFINPNHPLVNCDKGELALTGAFQIIDLNWFVKQRGLNPSLARIFQDIDLCLKADRVFYFGKDKFFYHDESLLMLNEEKNEHQMVSDNLLFSKIWPRQVFINKMLMV